MAVDADLAGAAVDIVDADDAVEAADDDEFVRPPPRAMLFGTADLVRWRMASLLPNTFADAMESFRNERMKIESMSAALISDVAIGFNMLNMWTWIRVTG